MMELQNGRPADCAGRLPKEVRCYDFLDRLGIAYQRIDHAPADNMEACEEIDRALDAVICKNLLLCNRQKTAFYLLMLPGDKHFKTSVLSKEIGSSRLSFAPEELLWELLHCTPGSATVLGLANDTENRVQLLIDRDVYDAPCFSCHPCICTSTLRLKTADVLETLLPAIGHAPVIVDL